VLLIGLSLRVLLVGLSFAAVLLVFIPNSGWSLYCNFSICNCIFLILFSFVLEITTFFFSSVGFSLFIALFFLLLILLTAKFREL
jgi:hypothetical protein